MEIRRQGSPVFGWSSGLVKECLRGHSSAHVFATPVTNFYLTLHDVAAWFLDDVLVPILGDLKTRTLVFMGLAEKGKAPIAQAVALAVSEYHILVAGKEERNEAILQDCLQSRPATWRSRNQGTPRHPR